jgi:acyl carrier protein
MKNMNIDEGMEKIKKMLMKQKGLSEFDEKASLRQAYGFDSLDFIELICEIEEVFNVEVDEEEASNLDSLSEIEEYILTKYKGQVE